MCRLWQERKKRKNLKLGQYCKAAIHMNYSDINAKKSYN